MTNSIYTCPSCGGWLNYDGDTLEWHCCACDYTEFEAWQFKTKFRKRVVEE